jgi:hypothetical protein
MEKIIKHYKTLLSCEQFVVTGSYALKRMGLCSECSDIDIILVNPTDEAKSICERLMKDYPAKTKPSAGSDLLAIFMHEDTKIDIFVETAHIETLSVDGFEISKADRIISAKKEMGRMKDWLQLREISREFFIQEEFENFLNNHKA